VISIGGYADVRNDVRGNLSDVPTPILKKPNLSLNLENITQLEIMSHVIYIEAVQTQKGGVGVK